METTLPQQRGRIVVGTDGSPSSVGAVRWALEAATLVGAWLDVVLVWNPDVDFGWLGTPPVHGWMTDPAEQGHALVRSVMNRVCGEPPAATVRSFVIEGDPVHCLLAHAVGADVLVLGDRGAGGFLGLQLGSVASACVSQAACPVLIVPTSRCVRSFSHLASSTVTARPAPPRDTSVGVAR